MKKMKNLGVGILLSLIIFTMACKEENKLIRQDLSNGEWTFRQADSSLTGKAHVPGCIHTDLLTEGLIEDPYYRDNEKKLQWIGEKTWIYSTTFDVQDNVLKMNNICMLFKGLDTYANIYLNDSLLLAADNFFREWKVDVRSVLKPKGNSINVEFLSPVEINKKKKQKSQIPLFNDYVYTRKPAYHFGWDWGPVFITAGIWKPIVIEAWDNVRFRNMHIIQQHLSDEEAKLNLIYEVEADDESEATLEVRCLENNSQTKQQVRLTKGVNKIEIPFAINNPKRWWSNGLGDAYLYKFQSNLIINGTTVDEINERIGLRALELVQKPDSIGKSFHFELNGVPVFMKGANYIPQDLFLNRPTENDYKNVINQAVAANMNMLRVWGGGFYENDIFYNLCDENGILVWQDFMFACSMYPGDTAFLENVKQEAVQNVKRLRNHPSIALWCGNNENYIGWKDWRWSNRYSKEDSTQLWQDYEKLYHELLANVIKENDSKTFYWPSSPLFGWGYPVNTEGDVHYWGIWHAQEPFENFQKPEFTGRFMSEYGFQGCPEMSSVKKFTLEEDWDINSPVMLMHQKHRIGYPVIDKYFNWYYKKPKDFEAYLYLSQVQQAFGIGIAFEAHRRAMPHCMGTLFWQINDCYPVTSWASIDCYGKWKALHYKTRELYKEVLVSPFVENERINIYVVSDKLTPIDAKIELKLYDFSGEVLNEAVQTVKIGANKSKIYFSETVSGFLKGSKKNEVVLVAKVTANNETLAQKKYYFVHPKELNLKKAGIKMTSNKIENGFELTFSSQSLAKDVFLSTENGDGFFTTNFFDVIPGNPVKLKFEINKDNFEPEKEVEIYSLIDSFE